MGECCWLPKACPLQGPGSVGKQGFPHSPHLATQSAAQGSSQEHIWVSWTSPHSVTCMTEGVECGCESGISWELGTTGQFLVDTVDICTFLVWLCGECVVGT